MFLDADDELMESSDRIGITKSDIKNTVTFSVNVLKRYNSGLLLQYGLLGRDKLIKETCSTKSFKNRIFFDTNIPSALICGVQGVESHTQCHV